MKTKAVMLIVALCACWSAEAQLSLVAGPTRSFGDRTVARTFEIGNEGTYTLNWRTRLLRGVIERRSERVTGPGRVTLELNLPAVRARVELVQDVQLAGGGRVVASGVFPLEIFPKEGIIQWDREAPSPVLGVIDESNALADFMEKAGWRIVRLKTNRQFVEVENGVVLVAADQPESIAEPMIGLRAFVERGGTVVFLEQSAGRGSFFEADETWPVASREVGSSEPLMKGDHPLLLDLKTGDLANWGGTGRVSARPSEWTQWPRQRAWLASSRENSLPLLTEYWGDPAVEDAAPMKGRVLLCQLDVGARLDDEPAAQLLLRNIIHYALEKPATREFHVLRFAVPEDGLENDKFERLIRDPKPEDMEEALAFIFIVWAGEAAERAHGAAREVYSSAGRTLIIQSPFCDEMLAAVNRLIADRWPRDARKPAPSLTPHELPGDIECEPDYANPLTWGIPADALNAAVAEAEDLRLLAPEEESPYFKVLTKPGILAEYKQGDFRLILCAMPVDDPENKTRERVMNQVIANVAELLGKEKVNHVMERQTR